MLLPVTCATLLVYVLLTELDAAISDLLLTARRSAKKLFRSVRIILPWSPEIRRRRCERRCGAPHCGQAADSGLRRTQTCTAR